MSKSSRRECSDCGSQDRREFLAATGALLGVAALSGGVWGAPSRSSAAETAVGRLYESLTAEQRKVVVLPWDDERRTRINANWHVTQADVRSFTKDQQVLITEIVKGVTSADGYERFLKQMEDDDGGIGQYSVGIFGDPSGTPFEFALTGRHLTLRADGDTTPGAAFGGPIVYGHGAEGDPKQNLFWYQTKQVNEVFAMLDGKQRDKALVASAPPRAPCSFARRARPCLGSAAANCRATRRPCFGVRWKPSWRRTGRKTSRRRSRSWRPAAASTRSTLPSIAAATWTTTRCGTSGGWRARPSSATSAAHRTSTRTSTWPGGPSSCLATLTK